MYKWDAKEYYRNSRNQKRWAQGLLAQIPLKGNESVLDVGCGDGKVTALIAAKLPRGRVLGIDSSPDMVGYAAATFQGKYKNLGFRKKNACRLGMTEAFDVVFSNACFHWIAEHELLLRSLYRALKPGGRFFVQMGAKGNFSGLIEAGKRLSRSRKWGRYFRDFKIPFHFSDPATFRALLKRCGFKVKVLRTFTEYMKYDTCADFRASLRTLWMPYSNRVPRSFREEYLDEIVSRYLKDHPPDSRGAIKVKMKRLEFQAEKPAEKR